jgi:hypothetical protein
MCSYNLTRSKRCIFSLPGIATESICVDLWGILKEILACGIGGLPAPLNLFWLLFNWGVPDMAGNIMSFCTSHFSSSPLIGLFYRENRSIKTVSETVLRHFISIVNCLAWPDPRQPVFLKG